MENELTDVQIMGATGNNTPSARLAKLQERKKTIEDTLTKYNQELKQLCLQEADLTGTIPPEMPLEPGESPPMIRRRVGTAYQLPESLIKNADHKDETITGLELQIRVHANMAEAAFELANQHSISRTLKRQHLTEYHDHKSKLTGLQELKDKAIQQQHQNELIHKQKKKPRPPPSDDGVSMAASSATEPFSKTELRHSSRSMRVVSDNNQIHAQISEHQRYTMPASASYPKINYKGSSSPKSDDILSQGLHQININGYRGYMDRKGAVHASPSYNTIQIPHSYATYNPQLSPHILRPHLYQQQAHSRSSQAIFGQQHRTGRPPVQASPGYYCSPKGPPYRAENGDDRGFHPHQIQPHQQYEHTTTGLGGYWKRLESGDIWCNSSPVEANWHRDKRFGSLDRRKNKRILKAAAHGVDHKSATLATVSNYSEHVRTAAIKSPQVISRRVQDNRQLVRTQSLGSVGAQTIDSVWPSDDNSSCESDNRSIYEAGVVPRQKQKEWVETSLDGPVSPTHSVISRSQSAIPSVLSPEEKYVSPAQAQMAASPLPPPQSPQGFQPVNVSLNNNKTTLEIPAESNPSTRVLSEANLVLYNNNIPRNCTVVQAGHCKPYHEETKPFEMSDFYKYSTKFNKSPSKQPQQPNGVVSSGGFQKSLSDSFENASINKNHNFSPTPTLMNESDLISSNFSEVHTWYLSSHSKQHQNSENSTSKGKSNATLV